MNFKFFSCLFFSCAALFNLSAQTLTDNFNDGDFSTNPAWLGNTAAFRVNPQFQLQLNENVAANSTRYLSVPAATSTNDSTTWEFWAHELFSPSSTNYARVYLQSSASDLTGSLNGYFIRLGGITGTVDSLELFSQTGTTTTKLIGGTVSALGGTTALARVRVTRNTSGVWNMYADYTGGTNYTLEGTATDLTHTAGDYFGVYCVFTSTRDTHFLFDDIRISPLFTDVIPPNMLSATAIGNTQVDVNFNEPISAATANNIARFAINNGINVTAAAIDGADPRLVHLTTSAINPNVSNRLICNNITDIAGNNLALDTVFFTYSVVVPAAYQDIIFNEIFADPSPQVGQPNIEYVELYNRTNNAINLQNYVLNDGSARTLPAFVLQPNAYVLLTAHVDSFPAVAAGDKIQLSGLSLTNSGELLQLIDNNGVVIDSLTFSDSWYRDAVKINGGWSLELINPALVCKGAENWIASNNSTGGTPAAQNSVYNNTPDAIAPDLLSATFINSNTVVLTFNDALDATAASTAANFILSNATVQVATFITPNRVELSLAAPMINTATYTVTVLPALTDCAGNTISTNNTANFVYYDILPAQLHDLIFNELMIDESPSQGLPLAEYIEIYNRANYAINLQGYTLTHRSTSSSTISTSTLNGYTILPNDYLILHSSTDTVWSAYSKRLPVTSFPSLNNTSAFLVLRDNNGAIVDSILYSDFWYRNSARAAGGWSLELINPLEICKEGDNWAASNSLQGGTPTAVNANYSNTPDQTSPQLLDIRPLGTNQVMLFFDEILDINTASTASNYGISGGLSVSAAALSGNKNVIITLSAAMTHLTVYTVTFNGVEDCLNNGTAADSSFTYYETVPARHYDILINEIFPDSDPQIGLPRKEYVELYNRSDNYINLQDFTFNDASSTVALLPYYVMPPNSYLVIYEGGDTVNYNQFGANIALVPFPDLNVSSDELALRDMLGNVIDAVAYTSDWYNNSDKAEGGWSLERINYNRPCEGAVNWSASTNLLGGTPCQANSLLQTAVDDSRPFPIRAYPLAADTIMVYFPEAMGDGVSINPANYSINNGISIAYVNLLQPSFNSIKMVLSTALQAGTIYTINFNNNLTDCIGTPILADASTQVALPQVVDTGDLLLNEILFNPVTGGADFIEFYNNSSKVLDLSHLIMANLDEAGNINQTENILTPYLIFPNQYVVVTPSAAQTQRQYNAPFPYAIVENDLPTYDDSEGTVFVYSTRSGSARIIDQFSYLDDYHSPLLRSEEGVSLEKINPALSSLDENNWHSAASTVGYGTPTYQNSVYTTNLSNGSEVNLSTNKVSPDADGFEDFVLINYNLDDLGYVAHIRVFDANGFLVKTITNGQLLPKEGSLQWDGTKDDGTKALIGIHIIHVELVNPNGKTIQYKLNCVVAARL